MTAVPLGETATLCVLCPNPDRRRVARPGALTDWMCLDRLDSQLGEILQRYARLSARLQPGHDFVRRAPGYHSRPPVDMRAAALRDPRSFPAQPGEPHSPMNLFISWGCWIRTQRRQKVRPAYPPGDDLVVLDFEWRYLVTALDWATRQPWIPTFSEQVKGCLSQMRSAGGEPNPRPLGECEECGHPLFPPIKGVDILCGGCGVTYDPVAQIAMAGRARVEADQAVATKPYRPSGSGCRNCPHESSQHSNDEQNRPCNVRWCDCEEYAA